MTRTPFRLAIAGCGDIGNSAALITRFNPRMKAVAACDISEDRVRTFARRFRIRQYRTDYTALLADGGFDAVYLGVPHYLHYEMICAAIRAGYPVLAEKPVTRTLDEGRRAVNLAAEHGVKLGVNYQHRYNPGCYRLARAVQNGDLGTVNLVRINIPWHREIDYFNKSPWHAGIESAGGGTLITQGSHFLDIALWALTGNPPVSAVGVTSQRHFTSLGKPSEARIEVEDLASGIIEMRSGAQIQICSSMIASSRYAVTIEVYGDRGTAFYSDLPRPHVRFKDAKVKHRRPPIGGFHPMQASLEGFRRWVVDDRPYLIPAVETLPVLAAVEAVYKTSRSGKKEAVQTG